MNNMLHYMNNHVIFPGFYGLYLPPSISINSNYYSIPVFTGNLQNISTYDAIINRGLVISTFSDKTAIYSYIKPSKFFMPSYQILTAPILHYR